GLGLRLEQRDLPGQSEADRRQHHAGDGDDEAGDQAAEDDAGPVGVAHGVDHEPGEHDERDPDDEIADDDVQAAQPVVPAALAGAAPEVPADGHHGQADDDDGEPVQQRLHVAPRIGRRTQVA